MKLEERAKMMSTLIRECDTDDRGELLRLVAKDLMLHSQGWTSRVVAEASYLYDHATNLRG
jgi:hypothetical protein